MDYKYDKGQEDDQAVSLSGIVYNLETDISAMLLLAQLVQFKTNHAFDANAVFGYDQSLDLPSQ